MQGKRRAAALDKRGRLMLLPVLPGHFQASCPARWVCIV